MIKIRQKDVAMPALPAPAPEPMPPRVAAFWFHNDDERIPPWRQESPDEKYAREEAEGRGCWTG